MAKITEQMGKWTGEFGKEYTDRNALTLEETEALYKRNYGVTEDELEDYLEDHVEDYEEDNYWGETQGY